MSEMNLTEIIVVSVISGVCLGLTIAIAWLYVGDIYFCAGMPQITLGTLK